MKKQISALLIVAYFLCLPISAFAAERPRAIIGVPVNAVPVDANLELGQQADNLISNWVTSLSFSSDGKYLWIGTLRGLSRLDTATKKFTNFTLENGLSSLETYSVLAMDNQECWTGTNQSPAFFNGKQWTQYDESQGFSQGRVMTIRPDTNGNVWFGTSNGLFEYMPDQKWRFFKTDADNAVLRDSNISSIIADNNGVLWIGASDLYSFVPPDGPGKWGDWKRYDWPSGFAKIITSLGIDKNNAVWVGTNRGVLVFKDGFWTAEYNKSSGLIDETVNAIVIDKTGNKWFGTGNGVSRLGFDGVWTSYKQENGLVNNNVMSMTLDSNGDIWFGTMGGISHFDGIAWENFRTDGSSVYNPIALNKEKNASQLQEFSQTFSGQDLDGHWAKEYFLDLIRQGIISGYADGTYRPDAVVTRGELLKMTLGSAGYDVTKKMDYDFPFTDVAKKSWLAPYIGAALDNKVVSNNNLFRPNDAATRSEAAVLMAKAFNLKLTDEKSLEFFDVPAENSAKSFIDILSSNKIVSGAMENVDVVISEYDIKDHYDLRLARDLGTALAEIGFFSPEQVSDYYTRDLFNAIFNYQHLVVYGAWNKSFGFPDDKTREMLGSNHIRHTEQRLERVFHPDQGITRGEAAKMLKMLIDKK
ncbi:MAG: S-layer homology domain-containing protein [Patescibacteria group bacterium]|nr:S-layer homology domain-containing protein [Patescibacteria group bacterium]